MQSAFARGSNALLRGRIGIKQLPIKRLVTAAGSTSEPGSTRSVLVSHILVNKANASVLDTAEEELKKGRPFSEVAQQYSTCSSRARGGQLGWLSPGDFFPEFEAAAFKAPVGSTVRASTTVGHHLILVEKEMFKKQASIQQMTVQELQQLLGSPAEVEDVQLVDVREQWEFDTAQLPGFKLFPLSQFQEWGSSITQRLDPAKQTVVLCHHGVRSMNMSQFLIQQGFEQVYNVTGGIDAYSKGADSNVPTY